MKQLDIISKNIFISISQSQLKIQAGFCYEARQVAIDFHMGEKVQEKPENTEKQKVRGVCVCVGGVYQTLKHVIQLL